MNWKVDNHDRKILTFPAVHPCSDVSPATLLASLITLSQNISSFQSKSIPTQRKNTSNSIRLVQILLIFFEEIRENHSFLSKSLILSFSELHLTLQKLHLLLQDCAKDGARVWILMKSADVASQFIALIRSIATALDVLPMDKVYVSEEVRELVELVAHQARKAKLGLDPHDEKMCKLVNSILDTIANGVEPDLGLVNSVLEYLSFRKWSECNNEIKFLDKLIGSESSGFYDERELQLMHSLTAFLCYCRGVVFDNPDYVNDGSSESGRSSFELISCVNSEDFRCPISLELMIDPVTVSTGQTYDRGSIQKWLKAGNTLCPKTGERLSSTELLPNHSLKNLIDQFCSENGVMVSRSGAHNRDISRTTAAGSPAAEQAMRLLGQFLATRLSYGTEAEQNRAAYEVRLLAKSNIFNRACLIEMGTIQPLLRLLYSSNPAIQENAIASLLKLSKHSQGKRAIMRSRGNRGLTHPVLYILNKGLKLESKQMAAATIFYLSSVEDHRKLIGDAIPGLVELVRIGTTHGKKNAIVALFALILHPMHHQRVLQTDAIPLLADILKSSDRPDLITDAVAVFSALSETVQGSLAIVQTSALPLISGLLKSSSLSRAGREYCLTTLLNLSIHRGPDVVRVLAKDTSLPGSLYGLITDGSPLGSKKARTLLKMVQQLHESTTSLP